MERDGSVKNHRVNPLILGVQVQDVNFPAGNLPRKTTADECHDRRKPTSSRDSPALAAAPAILHTSREPAGFVSFFLNFNQGQYRRIVVPIERNHYNDCFHHSLSLQDKESNASRSLLDDPAIGTCKGSMSILNTILTHM